MSPEKGGKWRTLPYQVGIMDALDDPEIERVTVCKSARVGYTQIVVAYVLKTMHHDPASMLIVQPTVEDAEGFSKDEIAPAIDRHDFLRGIVSEGKSKSSSNTILAKSYHGRTLWMTGTNSGRGFRRIHAKIALLDEVDGFEASAGDDGDPVELAWRRTQEAKLGRKIVLGSTPLLKGASRIERSYAQSDQRRFYVPCPHCDEWQPLEFGGKDVDHGIKWDSGKPETAYYLCRKCHAAISEEKKPWMLATAERDGWRAHAESKGHAGFHIWAGYSMSPNATWAHIASEWLRLKGDPVTLKTFVNTWLGEAWEQKGRAPSTEKLAARVEAFPAGVVEGFAEPQRMVPRDAVLLTSMTDVQMDRIECGVEGWGLGEENWKLEYQVFYGDPTAAPVWESLREFLMRPRISERGMQVFLRSSCIDSGYASNNVYSFVRPIPVYKTPDGRTAYMWATKGVTGTGAVWPAKPTLNTIGKCPLYTVKVDTAKDLVASRLETIETPGHGYTHFPNFLPENYFRQLTAEHCVDTRDKRGFPVRTWRLKEGHKRNEAFDVAVGNYAALCALYSLGFTIEREALWLDSQTQSAERPEGEAMKVQAAAPPSAPRRASGGSGWLGDTRGWL
jgi:phage terminase large subunit GpA-like protein